jgi:hypothetical protein
MFRRLFLGCILKFSSESVCLPFVELDISTVMLILDLYYMHACQSALQPWVSLGLLFNQSPPGVTFLYKIIFYKIGLLAPCPTPILEHQGVSLSLDCTLWPYRHGWPCTDGFALRVTESHKPHHHDKVETPLGGFLLHRLKYLYLFVLCYIRYGTDFAWRHGGKFTALTR